MNKKLTSADYPGIITLTTDWGSNDYYVGAVKGRLYTLLPNARVVDITHDIIPFDTAHAAYVLKNSFEMFPEGSVHIIGVDSEDFATSQMVQSHVAVQYKGHYFIGSDNGVFSLILDGKKADAIVELTIPFEAVAGKVRFSFSGRDRFSAAAVHLAQGNDILELGKQLDGSKELMLFNPSYTKDFIKGVVVHVDHFENAITNISELLFEKVAQGREFEISFKRNRLNRISKLYSDTREVEPLALFNGAGLLELALNRSNISGLLGLRKNDAVLIEFHD
ncbi:MAG: hypothetical protein DRJ09_00120 [Bacteroidetes bacterium]|nr:MAG: hypothetical protein DRJ09_00120 [Bacteroidota bacterium]